MARVRRVTSDQEYGLENFSEIPEEEGISLDQLSQAFAQMLGQGDDPYSAPATVEATTDDDLLTFEQQSEIADDYCEITPQSIIEAILFVGSPDNRPLTSQEIAALMRGVSSNEVIDIIRDLNTIYESSEAPYRIISEGVGYRFALQEAFSGIRERFYGRVRQTKLSAQAIEVLAMVAYNQPLTADEVNRLRGKPSNPVLSQLVRRGLLRIERGDEKPRIANYYTTERFLDVFQINSLDDLPRGQDIER